MAKKDNQSAGTGGDLRKWMKEIELAEKEHNRYWTKAKKVVKRYRDEDRDVNADNLPSRYNFLWSSEQTVAPLYFSRVPKVEVDRRWKERDPIGKAAAQIWERCVQFTLDSYDFGGVMKAVVKDFQLAARGTAWVRYEPTVQDDQIAYQEVLCDHVHFLDFLHAPGKKWPPRWIARKIYLTRKECVRRFGKDLGMKIPLDYSAVNDENDTGRRTNDAADFKQAKLYEIWDSDKMQVLWLSKSYSDNLLDVLDDPLGLHDFYPTPKPLYGTTTTETLIPIPDYLLYQDQAKELDQLTMKISLLEDALRLVGVYNSQYANQLGQVFANPRQNEMIPIPNWGAWVQAGGMKGVCEWMPIEQIIEALTSLYDARDRVKQDLYEITGIADVIRGVTAPNETATAQQIKGQFASTRISDKQRDVQRYARDLAALQGEIISEHFELPVIAGMCGANISSPEVQQLFMQAVEMLKSDPMRTFRLELETDSMVAIDETLDKQRTTEFIKAYGQLLESFMPIIAQAPVLTPMFSETMMYLVRQYDAGRGLESAIEQGMEGLMQMAQQAAGQPKPNPEMIKIQGEMQIKQQEAQQKYQLQQQAAQQEFQLKQAESANKIQVQREEIAGKMALERDRIANEAQAHAFKAEQEIKLKTIEMQNRDKLETKKAVLTSGLQDLHLLPNGEMTTKPTVVKEGEFYFDPATGNRKVRIIERPMMGEGHGQQETA